MRRKLGYTTLDLALALTEDVQRAYRLAGPQERRLLNQGLSERFLIEDEEVVQDQRAEPFGQLLELGKGWTGAAAKVKASAPY